MNPIKSNLRSGVLCALASLFLCAGANAQSLSGVRVGDTFSSASAAIGTKPIAQEASGPFEMRKWKVGGGNDLSVTYDRKTGRIIYAETNWSGENGGRTADFPGFTYGKTTLQDIRNAFGSNGFVHKEHTAVDTPQVLVMFNSYEIEGTSVVVTFATLISKEDSQAFNRGKNFDVGKAARLDSIILAEAGYLDTIWGENKLRDPAYKPIRWGSAQKRGTTSEHPLECTLKMSPRVKAGERVLLFFKLTNRSAQTLYVLDWDTPLEGSNSNALEVTRDGTPVPYEGRTRNHEVSKASSYHDLQPGFSEQIGVDVSMAYNLKQPGTYRIVTRGRLMDVATKQEEVPRSQDQFQEQVLRCPPVKTTIVAP